MLLKTVSGAPSKNEKQNFENSSTLAEFNLNVWCKGITKKDRKIHIIDGHRNQNELVGIRRNNENIILSAGMRKITFRKGSINDVICVSISTFGKVSKEEIKMAKDDIKCENDRITFTVSFPQTLDCETWTIEILR